MKRLALIKISAITTIANALIILALGTATPASAFSCSATLYYGCTYGLNCPDQATLDSICRSNAAPGCTYTSGICGPGGPCDYGYTPYICYYQ